MSLLDEIKVALRVTSDMYNPEIVGLIASAKADMLRMGIRSELVEPENEEVHPLVKQAITCWCKAGFGYDNPEAERFSEMYRTMVISLMNSDSNEAMYEVE